ncbi:hypothetical protein ABPG77_006517 [Micractinium sp. CCAP 211/92]
MHGALTATASMLAFAACRTASLAATFRSTGTVAATQHRRLKEAVRAGEPLFGLFLNSASPLVAEQLATIEGYDYMLVDIQHAPTDYANLAACITAVNAAGLPALVRVEGPHDRGGIQQALDLGAAGNQGRRTVAACCIMVPTINTAADVEKAVSAAYYPSDERPTGSRSISWPIRPQLGRGVADYVSSANDEVTVMVQCETRQCHENLGAVLSVPGVDACFVGPVDLSHALGLAQSLGFPACFDSPQFKDRLARILRVCRAKGVTPGNFAVSEQKAQEMLGQGFTLLATGTDVGLMAEAAAKNAAFQNTAPAAAESSKQVLPPPASSGSASSAAASLPPERLKQLRRDGLALKDVIKMGRRGAADGLAKQVQQRWNTSEVARLHCHGKHAANMKLLVQQLEEATGGIVVHRAGGTVLLYRGDSWQRAEGQPRIAEGQQQEEGQDGGGKQHQHQQQQAPPVSDC